MEVADDLWTQFSGIGLVEGETQRPLVRLPRFGQERAEDTSARRLAAAGRAIKQNALWRGRAHGFQRLRVAQARHQAADLFFGGIEADDLIQAQTADLNLMVGEPGDHRGGLRDQRRNRPTESRRDERMGNIRLQ